jgi:hypothetical protein
VNRFVFADGSGDDVLLGLDLSIDALVFNSAVSWTQSSYHGQASLLGTYDGGNSTVLLVGIASAQQPELMVEAPAGDLLGIG